MTVKCNKCKEEINKEDLEKNYYICPLCGKLNRMPAKNRLQMLTEKFDVMFNDQEFTDPIDFPSYKEKYESAREKSGETEGVVCGRGTIGGQDTCIFIMEPNFMMGSMGTVVGDRITALLNMLQRTDFNYRIYSFRWCKNAGGRTVTYADGQGFGSSQKTQ